MYQRILIVIGSLCLLNLFACKEKNNSTAIEIGKIWGFKYGFDTSYPLAAKNWDSISVQQFWEVEKNRAYNGYAWYQTYVYIPASLKKNFTKNDSLEIYLGPVDDCETTFLNGNVIGQNNVSLPEGTKLPDSLLQMAALEILNEDNRCYRLSMDDKRIRWNSLNKISVLALDKGGLGGFNMKDKQYIRKISVDDKLIFGRKTFYAPSNDFKIDTTLVIENKTGRNINGQLRISLTELKDKNKIYSITKKLNLLNMSKDSMPVSFPISLDPVVIKINIESHDFPKTYEWEHQLPYILSR